MKLSLKTLWTILTLFAVIFILFMSLTIYGTILISDDFENEGAVRDPQKSLSGISEALDMENITSAYSYTPASGKSLKSVAAVNTSGDTAVADSVRQWCIYSKFSCRIFDSFPDVSKLSGFDIIVFDVCPTSAGDIARLEELCGMGTTLVFAELPDAEYISSSPRLMSILGVAAVEDPAMEIDGVHLYGDFYLSSDRLYVDDDYYGKEDDMRITVPYFTLNPGYEVYAAAILDNQDELEIDNEKLPPLLWKTTFGNSRVCVINCDAFAKDALMGTLTAFVSRTTSDGVYIYPVVNAQTNSITGYPWLSQENDEELYNIYGHESDTLSRSVLWPAVVQTLYVYHQTADFYVSAHTDYFCEQIEQSGNMASYSIRQIHKILGTLGLSLKQRSNAPLSEIIAENESFFAELVPSWRFSSVYAGDFSAMELIPYLSDKDGILGDVSMVLTDRKQGEPIISVINGDVLSVGLTSYGFSHEARDDIALLATQTALALDNQYIDMDRVMYPEGGEDYWNDLSVDWSSATTYYNDFKAFDYVLASGLEDRVRTMLLTDYSYETTDDRIVISLDKPEDSSAYLIVRMFNTKPSEVEGGTLTKLTDTAYLLKADSERVTINREPLYWLDMP